MTTRGDFAVGLFADGFNYLFHVHHNTINQARAVMFVCVSAMLRSSSSRQTHDKLTTNSRHCTLHIAPYRISRHLTTMLTTPHDSSRQTHDNAHDSSRQTHLHGYDTTRQTHDILTTMLTTYHDRCFEVSRQLTTNSRQLPVLLSYHRNCHHDCHNHTNTSVGP